MKTTKRIIVMMLVVVLVICVAQPVFAASVAVKPPTAAKAASAGYNSVKVSWKAGQGLSGYQVYRATSKNGKYKKVATVKGTSKNSYSDKKLTTNKTYYYKVRGFYKLGGATKYTKYTSVVKAAPKPAKVKTPVKKTATYNSVTVSWSKVSGASGYQVYRATSANGKYKKVATVGKSTVSYKDKSLTTGKKYFYKVRAYRKVSGKTVYGSWSAVLETNTALGKVGGVKTRAESMRSIEVTWNKVSGASGYEVYRSNTAGGTYSRVKDAKDGIVRWWDNDTVPGRDYYYKVRAYRTVSGKKVYGSYSAAVKGTNTGERGNVSVTMTWTTVEDATRYEVYRKTSDREYYLVETITNVPKWTPKGTMTYTDTGLKDNTTYDYGIAAYNGNRVAGYVGLTRCLECGGVITGKTAEHGYNHMINGENSAYTSEDTDSHWPVVYYLGKNTRG